MRDSSACCRGPAGTGEQREAHRAEGQAELDQLESYLKPLIQTWEGAAQEAYYAAQREWDKAAANMQEITAKMGMAVNAANEAYQAGERRNAARFGG